MHNPVNLRMEVLGLKRPQKSIVNIHGVNVIPDTQYCEDLHYHGPSILLLLPRKKIQTIAINGFHRMYFQGL